MVDQAFNGFSAPDFSVAKACPMMETVAFTEYLAEDGSLGAHQCAMLIPEIRSAYDMWQINLLCCLHES